VSVMLDCALNDPGHRHAGKSRDLSKRFVGSGVHLQPTAFGPVDGHYDQPPNTLDLA
jgi:hypothetical protein